MEEQLKQQMVSDGVLSQIVNDRNYFCCCFCYGLFEETKKPNLLSCGKLCCSSCLNKMKEKNCSFHSNHKVEAKIPGYDVVLRLINFQLNEIKSRKVWNFLIMGYSSKSTGKFFGQIPENTIFEDLLRDSSRFQHFKKNYGGMIGVFINNKLFRYNNIQDKTVGYLVQNKNIVMSYLQDETFQVQFHNLYAGG